MFKSELTNSVERNLFKGNLVTTGIHWFVSV